MPSVAVDLVHPGLREDERHPHALKLVLAGKWMRASPAVDGSPDRPGQHEKVSSPGDGARAELEAELLASGRGVWVGFERRGPCQRL
jgi:hypothetical protein